MKNRSICSLLLLVFLFVQMPVTAQTGQTADFLIKTVTDPMIGTTGGDWTVMGLARSQFETPQNYFETYYKNVEREVKQKGGVLHDKKYTEYARVVLALTAIGKNPEQVAGYHLVKPLTDFERVIFQGVNGAAYALLALDCGGYERGSDIREQYLSYIKSSQAEDGSFSLDGKGDVDVTAMVLTALAPYQNQALETIERGLSYLSAQQTSSGGFVSKGLENAESCAQVIVALSSLGLSMDDPRFVKNEISPDKNLQSFLLPSGGFCHTKSETEPVLMATEQAFYALVALERKQQGKSALFDMKDVIAVEPSVAFGLPGKREEVTRMPVINPEKTFDDLLGSESKTAIEALAARGIINGKTDNLFEPQSTMTRAEFACIMVKALGLPLVSQQTFQDVTPEEWYFSFVSTAYQYGLVSGVSESSFDPDGTITREEGAAMVARGAKLCGMNTDVSQPVDVLSQFEDYRTVSSWAMESLAFCYEKNILSQDMLLIQPDIAVKREEIAQMIYQMMDLSNLL